MDSNTGRWFIKVCILVLCFSSFIFEKPINSLWAFESDGIFSRNPFLVIDVPEKETKNAFILVDAQTFKDQLLDNQELENISPALVAPVPVIISRRERNQIIKQDYDNSICFKRCHSRNDFSSSAYTVKQWRMLIGEDGHAIFCKIPWDNSHEKEKVIKYLFKTADNYSTEPEGVGVW